MLVLLVGKTASGKDSIRKILIEKYGIKPVITYTTRPMRPGEEDGVTYHFVSDGIFDKMVEDNAFVETTSYKVANGSIWKYGTPIEGLDGDKVIILNPSGVKAIKSNPKIDCKVFYIEATDGTISNRLRFRGDNKDEAARRIKADKFDFKNINKLYDFAIKNEGDISAEIAAKIIFDIYTTMKGENNESIIE